MTALKSILKRLVPAPLLEWYRARKRDAYHRRNMKLSAKDVFTSIYRNNEWGGRPGEFKSGSGSTEQFISSYAEMVQDFVRARGLSRVIDLGCGDFAVGGRLQLEGVQYVGVDIVDDLIERNRELYGREGVTFLSLDMISDPLPHGDLCLIRQVLQHLSNDEIKKVLGKLAQYRFVIVTEHYPAASADVIPNRDKPHGGDTRVVDNSAVYLDHAPFDQKIDRLMLDVAAEPLVARGERLRSFLIVN